MPVEIGEATVSHESPALNEHRIAALVPYDIVRPLRNSCGDGEPKFQAWALYQRSDKDPRAVPNKDKGAWLGLAIGLAPEMSRSQERHEEAHGTVWIVL